MPKGKRHTPEQIVAILRRSESGETVTAVCRETNISAATFHRWKSQYGGMDLSELQQLRGLRDENARLKKLLAEQMLDNAILKDIAAKKVTLESRELGQVGQLTLEEVIEKLKKEIVKR